MAATVTAASVSAVAYGTKVNLGMPELEIPGVVNLQSQTITEGYENVEEFPDTIGNIGTVVFSRYTKTISFTGLLAPGATPPYGGMKFELGEGWTAAIQPGLQVAPTATVTNVSGTIKAWKKLAAPTNTAGPEA